LLFFEWDVKHLLLVSLSLDGPDGYYQHWRETSLPAGREQEGTMVLVTNFSPLGNLTDLQGPSQLSDWSREVEHLMTMAVAAVEKLTGRGKSQFADPSRIDMAGAGEVPIAWKGFPISLVAQGFSDADALKIADGFLQDQNGLTGRDVQDEYLEWYVHRDATGDVVQIDFTTEGPEYWTTLVSDLGKDGVMRLYNRYYPDAQETDVFPGGQYNPDNVFNNTRGAMHLRQVNNNLWAEVTIAALSTLTYTKGGVPLQSGADLCNEARLGVATRASDPHIAEIVNGAAQTGTRISLKDPIGLYMDPPDFTGWVTPDGSPASALWTSERGNPLTRGSLKSAANFKLGDVMIGGQCIAYGGQVAKLVNIQLTGLVSQAGTLTPTRVPVESLQTRAAQTNALALQVAPLRRTVTRAGR
jgi:hypothetical protein